MHRNTYIHTCSYSYTSTYNLKALLGHSNNGEALLAANKYAEAVVAFEAGLSLDPTDAVCLQGLQRSKV